MFLSPKYDEISTYVYELNRLFLLFSGYNITMSIAIEWLYGFFRFTVKYYKCANVVCAPEDRSIYNLCWLGPTKKTGSSKNRKKTIPWAKYLGQILIIFYVKTNILYIYTMFSFKIQRLKMLLTIATGMQEPSTGGWDGEKNQ